MNKTYILDTNVLLSDSNALYSFKENNIILPFIVIEELDRHKDRQDDVGRNARETARKLSAITKEGGNLSKGISLGEGMGTLRVLSLNEAAAGNIINIPIELEEVKSGDNTIIKFCLNYINANSAEKVILVTRDVLLQLKCVSLNILVEDYKKFYVASSVNNLYSGCLTIDDIDVTQFYKDPENFRLPEEISDKLQPNEFLILKNSNSNSHSALVRFLDKDKPLKKITKKILNKFETRNKEQEFAIDLLLDPNIKLVTLVGSAGTGKAQPLNSKLLTPTGWTTMGQIKVGDKVIGKNGNSTTVIGVFPQGKKEIYKVTFTDGSSTECCKEHLWDTATEKERNNKSGFSTKTLEDIMHNVQLPNRGNRKNHMIPMVSPIEFESKEVPIEPYSLGLLLGDGRMSTENSVSFSTSDRVLIEHLQTNLPDNCVLKQKSKYDWYIVRNDIRKTKHNLLNVALKNLGLLGLTSCNKFIPNLYKYNSLNVRLAVFQGLMDTNGYVSGTDCAYYSTSESLIKDVQELVWSFGGKATIQNKWTKYKNSKRHSYVLQISLPASINPCRLERKKNVYTTRTKYQPTRFVDKIDFVGIQEAQCIRVNSLDNLYVTDDYIVTHNTLCALAAGLEQVVGDSTRSRNPKGIFKSLVVCRPVQPVGKDIGFLPGPTPLYTPVLTPVGWVTIGELKVGDEVISQSGKATKVTGVFDKGQKEILKLTFEDGSVAECCEDHPWNTFKTHEKKTKTRSTKEIEQDLKKNKYWHNHFIEFVQPIEYTKANQLLISPYTLGALLGDGCLTNKYSIELSSTDKEIVNRISLELPKEMIICHKNKFNWSIIMSENQKRKKRHKNLLNENLQRLNLIGKNSRTKFIPQEYLFSSVENRIALLQGLMDTDGYISKDGNDISFTTCSKQLAYDFKTLVFSLGGFANIKHYPNKSDSYTVSVSFWNKKINPFSLTRKSILYKSRSKQRRRKIVSIERTGFKTEMRCISVEDSKHLYVINDFILTHNTMEEKMEPWIAPIKDNLRFLVTEGKKGKINEQVLQSYFDEGIIEIEAMTFIRGRSIADAFIIIDEAQNLNVHELKTILTRVGENTKIVLTGDIEQIDNMYVDSVSNGLSVAVERFKNHSIAGHVMLVKGERSELATIAARIL